MYDKNDTSNLLTSVNNSVNEALVDEARNMLIQSIPISEYLYRNEIIYNDNEYGKIRCPLHDESTPSCIYDDKKEVFNCFGCGKGGSVVELHLHYVRKTRGKYSYYQALQDLAKTYNIKIPDIFDTKKIVRKPELVFNRKERYSKRNDLKEQQMKLQLERSATGFINADIPTRYAVAVVLNRYELGIISLQKAYQTVIAIRKQYNKKVQDYLVAQQETKGV